MKYFFNITRVHFHLEKKNVLIAQGWFRNDNPEGNNIAVFMGSQQLDIKIDEYSGLEVRQKYLSLYANISKEYFVYIVLPSGWIKNKKLLIYTVNGDERKCCLELSVKRLLKMQKDVDYNIDSITCMNNTCTISGWCVSLEDYEIEVHSHGRRLSCDIDKVFRRDVAAAFKEVSLNQACGFKIEFSCIGVNHVNLLLKTKYKQSIYQTRLNLYKKGATPFRKGLLFCQLAIRGRYITNGLQYLRLYGVKRFSHKAWAIIRGRNTHEIDYNRWAKRFELNRDQILEQKQNNFTVKPKFSIVVPLYKTPEVYLSEMIQSVINQTYDNWELCLSDGSGTDSPLTRTLKDFEQKDQRIRVVYNNKKLSISENTNAAISIARGDYIVFMDHDDLLVNEALYQCAIRVNNNKKVDVIYSDEDKISMDGKVLFQPHFKSDYNEFLLCSMNYISHLYVVKKDLLDKVGGLDSNFDGAQDYDLIFRTIEASQSIEHIPKVLYHWRSHFDSTSEHPEAKEYAFEAGRRAIEAHYKRMGIPATVEHGAFYGIYRTRYHWAEKPKISIIIPNKDHVEDLDKCLKSLIQKTVYPNYNIIIVENNSVEEKTYEYYKKIERTWKHVRVVYYKGAFNFSAINNYGRTFADGEYLLLLNNDTEIIDEICIEELLYPCMCPNVGIVGAKLYYSDHTVQHAGVVIGFGGIAGHTFIGFNQYDSGYFSRLICAQNYSAVTAACMMIKREAFDAVGGLSEEFEVAFNDIDFCLKVRKLGMLVVYNPYAQLYHYESKSRGLEDTPQKIERFNGEAAKFLEKWPDILTEGDPYYNVNLSLDKSDFSLKP